MKELKDEGLAEEDSRYKITSRGRDFLSNYKE